MILAISRMVPATAALSSETRGLSDCSGPRPNGLSTYRIADRACSRISRRSSRVACFMRNRQAASNSLCEAELVSQSHSSLESCSSCVIPSSTPLRIRRLLMTAFRDSSHSLTDVLTFRRSPRSRKRSLMGLGAGSRSSRTLNRPAARFEQLLIGSRPRGRGNGNRPDGSLATIRSPQRAGYTMAGEPTRPCLPRIHGIAS